MTQNKDSSQLHHRILKWLRFPPESEDLHLYQIGCVASTLNVHAQQKRAFNLVWSLQQSGFKFSEHSVAVIGEGIAGLTVAGAFLAAGIQKVTIYERTNHFIHLQQGNETRCLHPNFSIWPDERFRYPVTHLPFMNWRAGAAGEVADQLLWQWTVLQNLLGERIERIFACSVRKLKFEKGKSSIKVATEANKSNGTLLPRPHLTGAMTILHNLS